MTLSKLAQLANVSVAVVSKAFAGKDGVSEAMREHVFAVAREHGCFRQFYHARYDKPVIAVIIPEAISKYYIRYVEALKSRIEESGYTMLLSISNFDSELTAELVKYYSEHIKVDGLILVNSQIRPTPTQKSPDVTIITPHKGAEASYIHLRDHAGMSACVAHLLKNGHERIGYVGEARTVNRGKRLAREMEALGVTPDEKWFYSSNLRFEKAGIDGVDALLSAQGERPTAILGAYGYITQGIIERLEQLSLRVPEDISVASLDGEPFPIHRTLDVSHLASITDEICEKTIEILRKMMNADSAAPYSCTLDLEAPFYEGDTIGRARTSP